MLHSHSRILIQGSTLDPLVARTIERMLATGTHLVGIVNPGSNDRGDGDLPIFDLVSEAHTALDCIDFSLILVPPFEVLDAALEAIAAGIPQICISSSGVPPLDIIKLYRQVRVSKTTILGSGSAGIIIPDRLLFGTYNPQLFKLGKIAIVSRTYSPIGEIASVLNQSDLGESIVIHLGSDRSILPQCDRWLEWIQTDPQTDAIVLVGDVWWDDESIVWEYLHNYQKPIVAYLPGLDANMPKSLGDDAIVLSYALSKPIHDLGTIRQRIATFDRLNIPVAKKVSEIPTLISQISSTINS
jgi:succinyl-CoA synthetase alpha subunit